MLADSAILPLVTALIAGALAARMAGSAARSFAPSKPLWALGLLLFAAASAAAAYGTADGWGSVSFRVYYLTGACLCVALLGAGSAFLALPRTLALIIFGMTITATIGATVTVLIAPVDASAFATLTGLTAPPNSAIGGHAAIWAIAMNSVGTVLLIIGAGANRKLTSRMLTELVEKTGIPYITTQLGKGVIDERNPKYLGCAALSSGDFVHRIIESADVIINVGHDVIEKPPFFLSPVWHSAQCLRSSGTTAWSKSGSAAPRTAPAASKARRAGFIAGRLSGRTRCSKRRRPRRTASCRSGGRWPGRRGRR